MEISARGGDWKQIDRDAHESVRQENGFSLQEAMTYQLRLTEEDYVKGAFFHGRRWLLRFALPYFVVLSALMFWIGSRSAGLGMTFQVGFMVFLAAMLLFKWFVQFPARARKIYQQQPESQSELTCTLEDEHFGIEHKNGFIKKPWPEFLRWRHNDEFIHLYLTDNAYFVIPRRCLSDEEWNATLAMGREKLGE